MANKTFRQIRDFLNTLTEDQLDQEAFIMGQPDEGIKGGPVNVDVMGEDYYCAPGEQESFPKSSLTKEEWIEFIEEYGDTPCIKADQVFFWIEV